MSPQSPMPPRDAQAEDGPADYEEYEDFSSLPDTRSIASDDSFYPPGGEEECGAASAESVPEGVPEAATLLRAACANDVGLLRALVRRGLSSEEVQETDRNGRVSPRPVRVWVPLHSPPLPLSPTHPKAGFTACPEYPCFSVWQWDPICSASSGSWREMVQLLFLLHPGLFSAPGIPEFSLGAPC